MDDQSSGFSVKAMKHLAIFDFDGTITDRDSFGDFIFYSQGWLKILLGCIVLSPVIFLYAIRILSNSSAKTIVFRFFFNGWTKERFEDIGRSYAKERLPALVKVSAWQKIQWHKAQGDDMVVVTASLEEYVAEWCRQHHLRLIATQTEYVDGKVTGRLGSANCHGLEKIRRIREEFHLTDYGCVVAYGDSRGDLALKDIADEFHYRCFR